MTQPEVNLKNWKQKILEEIMTTDWIYDGEDETEVEIVDKEKLIEIIELLIKEAKNEKEKEVGKEFIKQTKAISEKLPHLYLRTYMDSLDEDLKIRSIDLNN